MKTERIKKLMCILCLGLPVVFGAVAATPTETPSILDRVYTEDDSELAELIRVAIEKREGIGKKEKFEIIRKVTQSYAQIKLLDLQIAEVSRKAESQTGPAEMQYELLLAKAELESKRAIEIANLRDLIGVIPRLPFAEQPILSLNTWISLQVAGGRVYVLEGLRRFREYWIYRRWKFVGWLPEKETLDYIRGKLKDSNNLPVRIEIYYDIELEDASEDLRKKIIALAKETHAQMDTQIKLNLIHMRGSGTSTFFLRQGKITTFHSHSVQRPDGSSKRLSTGFVNPNDLEQHILWFLTKPANLPLTFRIEYDETSALLAKMVADTTGDVLKRLGITELVPVKFIRVDPVPETAFLGRWRSTTRGDFQAIDIRPNGGCQVTMGDRFGRRTPPGAVKTGTSVNGTWLLTSKAIFIDIDDLISDSDGSEFIYRGYLDEGGDLIVHRGQIFHQGTFHESSPARTILREVE